MKIELCVNKGNAGVDEAVTPPDGNTMRTENRDILGMPVFPLQAGSALLPGIWGMETASGTGNKVLQQTNKSGKHI
jgi:hypothetical protein